jgi:prepilin-type N-terminal cleavage/methylation domain-containing protein
MIPTKSFSNENGFTLIETLMAIAVMAIGLLSLAALQATAISGNAKAKKNSMAILLAEDQIENYKNLLYANIPEEDVIENGSALPKDPWGIYTRTTTVQDNTPIFDTKTINVSVSWQDKVQRTVVFQTIAQNENLE